MNGFRKWHVRNDWHYIGALILIPLIIGLVTFRDYGKSTDESGLYVYSDYSLHAYRGLFNLNLEPDLGKEIFRYYGPSFLMMANIFVRLAASLSDFHRPDIWHLTYFLSFQLCVLGLYFLAKRWFSVWTSFVLSVLFLFQPLIWGHAFINPKDIPFMSFCLLSVLAGFSMKDKLFPSTENWMLPGILALKQEWYRSKTPSKTKIIRSFLLASVILVILAFGKSWIIRLVSLLLPLIYLHDSGSLITKMLSFIFTNYQQIPPEMYIPKIIKFVNITLFIFAFILFLRMVAQLRVVFVNTPILIKSVSLSKLIKDVFVYLKNPSVIVAGLVLGLTFSIRILGPYPGLIVLVVSLYYANSKVLPAFISYFMIAFTVTYLTWPYLWGDPIGHFKSSLMYMIDFPWNGKVLFDGNYYPSDQLPIGYVPVLFAIQFTEPVIFLFLVGSYIFFRQIWKQDVKVDFAITTLLWGILPFFAFTVLRPSLYDNTRQLLFIVPPLFLVVGLALEKLFQSSRRAYINISILALLLLPGVLPIIRLHPYQYTYYNSFVHDTYKRFEADYWATSFREAIEYLNQIAPTSSKVIVYGPGNAENVSGFARPDLIIDPFNGARFNPSNGYQYAIISTRNDRDLKKFTDWITIYSVKRDDNIFALVKQKP